MRPFISKVCEKVRNRDAVVRMETLHLDVGNKHVELSDEYWFDWLRFDIEMFVDDLDVSDALTLREKWAIKRAIRTGIRKTHEEELDIQHRALEE